jgi:hypothetical protein
MTDYRPPYQPSLGQPTIEELQAEAERDAARFGYSVETALEILKSGGSLVRSAAMRDVRTLSDFEEARRRLREFDEAERKRKAQEAGF